MQPKIYFSFLKPFRLSHLTPEGGKLATRVAGNANSRAVSSHPTLWGDLRQRFFQKKSTVTDVTVLFVIDIAYQMPDPKIPAKIKRLSQTRNAQFKKT
jgi:hypothetical protein